MTTAWALWPDPHGHQWLIEHTNVSLDARVSLGANGLLAVLDYNHLSCWEQSSIALLIIPSARCNLENALFYSLNRAVSRGSWAAESAGAELG